MEYDAIVYDLDGTLVHLAVDWESAHRDTVAELRRAGITVDGEGLWALLDRSRDEGFRDIIEGVLSDHERRGARTSERLSVADELPRPEAVGVCSLNAESACRIALDQHGLESHVEAVVGRDTVDTYKPDPQPLLTTIASLSATPEETLFVGDTERDALTAERAGVDFRFVGREL